MSNLTKYVGTIGATGRMTVTLSVKDRVLQCLRAYFQAVTRAMPTIATMLSDCEITESPTAVSVKVHYYIAPMPKTAQGESMNLRHNPKLYTGAHQALALLFTKPVHLSMVRVDYVYMNSGIFSQFLWYNSTGSTYKDFISRIMANVRMTGSNLPASITGLSVTVNGRLVTEKVVPRKTSKTMVIGHLNAAYYVDHGLYTAKNDLGIFTIKVAIGHTYYPTYHYLPYPPITMYKGTKCT